MNSDTPSYIPPNRTSQLPENNKKVKGRTLAHTATVGEIQPRLLDLEATAAYLGISPWKVRELEWFAVAMMQGVSLARAWLIHRRISSVSLIMKSHPFTHQN